MNIHDEMHRLVLRSRWIRWSLKRFKEGDRRYRWRLRLSGRLSRWRPTWEQRHQNDVREVG